MMTIECAVSMAMRRCKRLYEIVASNEAAWQSMDRVHRDEIGMLRCFMANAGVEKDKLPETPFLDPAHLEAFQAKQAEWSAKKKAKAEEAA